MQSAQSRSGPTGGQLLLRLHQQLPDGGSGVRHRGPQRDGREPVIGPLPKIGLLSPNRDDWCGSGGDSCLAVGPQSPPRHAGLPAGQQPDPPPARSMSLSVHSKILQFCLPPLGTYAGSRTPVLAQLFFPRSCMRFSATCNETHSHSAAPVARAAGFGGSSAQAASHCRCRHTHCCCRQQPAHRTGLCLPCASSVD